MAETTATKREIGDPMEALSHFFILATTQDHSAAKVAACMLLGLYNGYRFQFDLTELRRLDASNLKRALALLEFDARPRMEVHEWLNRLYGRTGAFAMTAVSTSTSAGLTRMWRTPSTACSGV